MIERDLMPKDPEARRSLRDLDPYELRRRGLNERLTPFEFGRALFHLNQRRGFRSNRRVNKEVNDQGKIATAVSGVRAQMAESGARTVGEWLAERHSRRDPVRARLHGQGARSSYELYVQRSMIEDEFDLIWSKQAPYDPALFNESTRALLRDALLFQRALRPVAPGRCPFESKEFRAPLALPTVQRFRMLQELNHLRYRSVGATESSLTLAERNRALNYLADAKSRSFEQLRQLLELPEASEFNLETAKRKGLKGCTTSVALRKVLGAGWDNLSATERDEITNFVVDVEDEATLVHLLSGQYGFSEQSAKAAASVRLDDQFGSLSLKAINKILPHLESDVRTYDQAARLAGYDHARRDEGGALSKLPYYAEYLAHYVGTGTYDPKDRPDKRYGRISNPTVHVGLNQLRQVVNAIIGKFGRPSQIVIELARDLKLSRRRKEELEKEQAENQRKADERRERLKELALPPTPGNMLRLRLWEDLASSPSDRRCPYSGDMISISRLFSDEIEIDHILPFAATLDDSANNKTISTRKSNRDKSKRTPVDAFGHSPGEYAWQAILDRAALLPPAKRKRFAPDALVQFSESGDFLARHLNDTAFLSRAAREYLAAICPTNKVWVVPGRLTAMLRSRWGLNTLLSSRNMKNRTDHRHHAIDATVVAVTDRALLQRMSSLSAAGAEGATARFLEGFDSPWDQFRNQLSFGLGKLVVSFKADHGVNSKLHNDTAYGIAGQHDSFEKPIEVVHRRPLSALKNERDLLKIRDEALRARLMPIAKDNQGKELIAALAKFSADTGIRRIRIVERLTVIPIADKDGHIYKGYKGDSNHSVLILQSRETGRWRDHVLSSFDAAGSSSPAAVGEVVMQLHVDDALRIQPESGGKELVRVVKISAGKITVASLTEGGALKERDADREDPFKYRTWSAATLQRLKAVAVVVDPLGQVWPLRRPGARTCS